MQIVFSLILINVQFLLLYKLELKTLVKIPASLLDFALSWREKEGDIAREKYGFSMLGNLVTIKPTHPNGKS